MKLDTTTEWLLSFEDGDEPSGYVSIGDRKVLEQRQAEAQAVSSQAPAPNKTEATAVRCAEMTRGMYRKAR